MAPGATPAADLVQPELQSPQNIQEGQVSGVSRRDGASIPLTPVQVQPEEVPFDDSECFTVAVFIVS